LPCLCLALVCSYSGSRAAVFYFPLGPAFDLSLCQALLFLLYLTSHCPCNATLEWILRESVQGSSGALPLIREEHIEEDNRNLFSMPFGSSPVDRRNPNWILRGIQVERIRQMWRMGRGGLRRLHPVITHNSTAIRHCSVVNPTSDRAKACASALSRQPERRTENAR
jgi:hypothetical protein